MRIFLMLLPFFAFGQKPEMDFNYALMNKQIVANAKANNEKQVLQVTYYPDSIPLKEWFKETSDTISTSVSTIFTQADGGNVVVAKTLSYPWPKDFPITDYRVISIYNPTGSAKKIYDYFSNYATDFKGTSRNSTYDIEYGIDKISCSLQAKDERGNWIDVDQVHKNQTGNEGNKTLINFHELISVIVKQPRGDFETELRYKLLVNSPPDYPKALYIYSNTFTGKIDKVLLSNK